MSRGLFVLLLLYIEFAFARATATLVLSPLEQYEGVKYLTYTKANKNNAVDIRDVNFDDDYRTVFVIHGFQAKNLDKSVMVKNDLFKFDLNVERVIIVSWLEYSRGVSYAYPIVVGQHVPRLAQDLYEKIVHIRNSGTRGAIELVGYSVGAHVAGQTGRLLKTNAGYTLDQIFGLDPVGILFKDRPDLALQNGDAKKVVVLHTNMQTYGFGSQIGPNDKIVNGGEKQPNCKIDVDKCSHFAAWNAFSVYARSRLGGIYEIDGAIETYKSVPSFGNGATEIILSGSEETIPFTVYDKSGKNAEFSVTSNDLYKFDVKLTSPDGNHQFSSSSPEFFSDNLAEKGFRIPYAEPGQWNLTVVKYSRRRLSARSPISIVARRRQEDTSAVIVLNADVSHRVLEYPKPITVVAELKFEDFPIIHADVYAEIFAPGQPLIRLPLYDDGIFPDELANDGIYTNDIVKLPNPERYTVSVIALSNGTAMSPMKEINFLLKDVVDCTKIEQNCTEMNLFQREAEAGAIKLVSHVGLDKIPPHAVSDLRAAIESEANKIVVLEWTSPRNDFFDIQIKRYDIRFLVNGTDFEKGLQLDESHVVSGSLNAVMSATKNEKISIRIPTHEWDIVVQRNLNDLKFAVKSIGHNNEISEISNIASVSIQDDGVEMLIMEYVLNPARRVCETFASKRSNYSIRVQFC